MITAIKRAENTGIDTSSAEAYLSSIQRGALRDASHKADRAKALRKSGEEQIAEADTLEKEADVLRDAAKRIVF